MNELVQLSTQDVSKAVPLTDTGTIAKLYEVEHLSITKLIDKYIPDFQEFGNLMSFQMTPEKGQRTAKAYYLNEEQFYLLVTFMKNTEIARKAKVQFVKAFSFQRKELLARTETRKIGKAARLSITDAIKYHISPNGNFKKFAYGNYTKLVYKRVLGKDVKRSKAERNCSPQDNLRDYLTIEELDRVQELESKIAGFIEVSDTEGKDDKQIYQMVKAWLDRDTVEGGES